MRHDHDYSLVGFCSPEAKKVLFGIRIHFPTFTFGEEIYKLEWFFLWHLLLIAAQQKREKIHSDKHTHSNFLC